MKFYIRSIPQKTFGDEIEMMEVTHRPVDPNTLQLDGGLVDLGKTEDKRLTFERFVQWQRLALIHSSISPESLKRWATRGSKQNPKNMTEFNVYLSYVSNINV